MTIELDTVTVLTLCIPIFCCLNAVNNYDYESREICFALQRIGMCFSIKEKIWNIVQLNPGYININLAWILNYRNMWNPFIIKEKD